MSSSFRKIYPSTSDSVVFLDGGLNSNFPISTIPDNESPDCLNVSFERGAVQTREGFTKLASTMLATAPFDGLFTRHDYNSSETMIAAIGGTFYDLQGDSFVTVGSGQSVYTGGTRLCHTEYENHLFVGNGSITPYKYNGADFTRHGCYPPTATMTAATDSTGVLSGDYNYKITWVNTGLVESDVGPETATFAAAAEAVAITSIPVAPQSYGVSARYIYRTEAGGTEYKYVDSINDNTTSSYTDNIADAALGVTAPTDNGIPPLYEFSVTHQDRIFCNDPANRNYVWYSEITNPYVFKVTNFDTFGDHSQDIVKGLEVRDNGILVYGAKTKTLWYMPDTDPANWLKITLNDAYGSMSPFGSVAIKDSVVFPAVEYGKFVGFGEIKGAALQPNVTFLTVQSSGSSLMTDKIKDQMDTVQTGYLANITSIVYQEKVFISVTYGIGETTNNRIYVVDYSISNLSRKQKYTIVPWTGINASTFTIYNGNLYFGSSDSSGYVYQMVDGTYNDDGNAIDSYYNTKEFTGFKGDENFNKDWRYLRMLVDKAGDWYMNVYFIEDSDTGAGISKSINLNPGGSLWGSMMYGRDDWGGGQNQEDIKVFLGGTRGKRVKFKFSNQNVADQRFKVHWLKYAYNLKGYR